MSIPARIALTRGLSAVIRAKASDSVSVSDCALPMNGKAIAANVAQNTTVRITPRMNGGIERQTGSETRRIRSEENRRRGAEGTRNARRTVRKRGPVCRDDRVPDRLWGHNQVRGNGAQRLRK